MNKAKVLFSIISYVVTLLLLIFLVINIALIVQRNILKRDNPSVFGYSMSVVVSGSMSPAIEVNDAIVTKAADDYEIGDIIMFHDSNSFIAHRIIAVRDGKYVTRGDANNTEDKQYVRAEDIVGKTVLIIPRFGVFIGFMQSPPGMLCLLLILVLLIELPKLVNRRKQG